MQRKIFWIFIIVFGLVNSNPLVSLDWNDPFDFRNVYLGSVLLSKQQNPYVDSTLKQEWISVCEIEKILNNKPPGLPQNFLVYPPHALIVFYPMSFLSYKTAVWVNFFVALISLFIWCYLLYNWMPIKSPLPFIGLMLIAWAFKGTMHALIVGQPSFLANMLALSGVYMAVQKNKFWPCVILFVLASFKPTTLLPYFIYLAYKKQWRLLLFITIGASCFFLFSACYFHAPIELLRDFWGNINLLKFLVFNDNDEFFLGTITEIRTLTTVFFSHWKYLYIPIYMATAISLIYLLIKNKSLNLYYLLSVLIIFGLLVSHHLFYDVLFILPIVWVYYYYPYKLKRIMMLCFIPFFLPINGLLNQLQLSDSFEFLFWSTPICLFILFVILILHPIHKKIDLFSQTDESFY